MSRKPLIIAIVAVVVAAAVYLVVHKRAASAGSSEEASGPTLVTVQTTPLTRATLHRFVEAFGTVSPAPAEGPGGAGSARVASSTAGVLQKTYVVEGQHVKKGDPLFDLDSRAAKVAVDRAEQAVKYAQDALDRQQRLFENQNTSKKSLQDAQAALSTAKDDLEAAQTQYEWTHIKAPLDGTVVRINSRPGEAVDLATPLAEIIDLDRLVVAASIPATDAADLKAHQDVDILAEPQVEGVLSYVSAAVDPANDTVTVRVALEKGSGLRPGQFVPFRIITDEHADVLAAPPEAVTTTDEGKTVISVVTGDEAVQHEVTVGYKEGNLVEIDGKDLKEGQAVVTVGAYGLPEKTKVKVVQEGEEDAPEGDKADAGDKADKGDKKADAADKADKGGKKADAGDKADKADAKAGAGDKGDKADAGDKADEKPDAADKGGKSDAKADKGPNEKPDSKADAEKEKPAGEKAP